MYVLWKEKHTDRTWWLSYFYEKVFFAIPFVVCWVERDGWEKIIVNFYGFFNNIWKHHHYKAVLNMYPILSNNYKIHEHTQSENQLISMIKLGPSLETRGKSFEKDWTKWNHRIVKMMKLQRLLSSLNQVNPSPRNPRKQQENQDFVGQLRWPIR